MRDLAVIDNWTRSFGLLPIHLNPNIGDMKFLMLNGGYADFCLEISSKEDIIESYFEKSWSTNTKNFVVINNDNIKVYNWLSEEVETIPKQQVENYSDRFYKYLLSKSYKTESDVVPFVLDIFRRLRNVTLEREKPSDALNLLFKLLISLEEDYSNIDYEKWGIRDSEIPSQFDYFVELMRLGVKSINPRLDLILRHVSGTLFQEAHREVIYFNPQRDLFGGISNQLFMKEDMYSSIHYTPQFLARSIVENCLKYLDFSVKKIKIFDPACGSSEFLIEVLKQLKNLGYSGEIDVKGWDISESAVNTSKFLLQYEKRTQWNDDNMTFEVRQVNNSLEEKWDDDFDLILMNPPFLSWELLRNMEERDVVLETLGGEVRKGKPNLASAFFYKSVKSLNNQGILGCILPSSIFTYDSYNNLRNEINEDLTIKIIAKLGNFVFEDALADVSFFIGQKPKTRDLPKLIWSKNEKGIVQNVLRDLRRMDINNQQAVEEKNYSIYTSTKFPIISDNWKIISLAETKFIKNIERFVQDGLLTRVSNLFSVKQGIRTGSKMFIIKLSQFEDIPISEKRYYRKMINNESIKNGVIEIKNYVWYPYDEKGLIIKNEETFREIAPYSYEKLSSFKDQLSNRARKDENSWWILSEHRAWLINNEKRLYSTEFGNANSFGFDKLGEYVIERGNGWIPKKEFTFDDYYFYLAFFSSNIFNRLLSIYSKQLAGGEWYDLGKKNTSNIPIPEAHLTFEKNPDVYFRLIELGKELESGNFYVKQVIDDILKSFFYLNV